MDIKTTVQPPVDETEESTTPEKEEAASPIISSDEAAALIRDYILNGTIEKTYTSKTGVTITFTAPTQGQLMQALTATDEEAFADDTRISVDRMQLIRNNNILAIYTKKFGKKDYVADQGDKFYSEAGFVERKQHLLDGSTMNVFAMDWAIKRLNDFQEIVTAAFDEDNLKNI